MTQWHEPEVGFAYQSACLSVTRAHQREKLAACGTDDALFGNLADPAFFIGLAIDAGIRSGISAQGNVNMLQRLRMDRAVVLGEELTVHGRIVGLDEVPRGQRITSEVWFEDVAGRRVISANRTSLRPDPAKLGVRGAGERPAPVIERLDATELLAEYQLTAQRVCDYSMEGNSIHYDEAAAIAAGFPAPLIGGGMGVHYLTAELWRQGAPQAFDAEIYFRRPIFWHDRLQVVGLAEAMKNAGPTQSVGSTAEKAWQALGLVRAGKVATELRINQITALGPAAALQDSV